MLYLRRPGPFRPRCASSRFRRYVTFPTYVHRYPRPVWSLDKPRQLRHGPTHTQHRTTARAKRVCERRGRGGGADEGHARLGVQGLFFSTSTA